MQLITIATYRLITNQGSYKLLLKHSIEIQQENLNTFKGCGTHVLFLMETSNISMDSIDRNR